MGNKMSVKQEVEEQVVLRGRQAAGAVEDTNRSGGKVMCPRGKRSYDESLGCSVE